MKPTTLSAGKFGLLVFVTALCIGLVSWGYQQPTRSKRSVMMDTIPRKEVREKKVKDLDDVLNELESTDLAPEMEKMKTELAKALKEIDGDKIRLEIEKAMKDIDLTKVQQEVQASLAKVDWKEVQEEISKAMKEIDLAKVQQEVQASLAKVDWEQMQKELAKIKEVDMSKLEADMKKMKEELKDLGPKLEKEMKKAKEEIEKAKAEIKEYKNFVDGLDRDGLINKKEEYKLEHKEGALLINGKKASEETYSKYRSFLEKHPKFSIKKESDDFDIDMD